MEKGYIFNQCCYRPGSVSLQSVPHQHDGTLELPREDSEEILYHRRIDILVRMKPEIEAEMLSIGSNA